MTTELETAPTPRIVLAYSSGLETSDAISWLAESYAAEIVAVTLDFGQGRELEALRDRALEAGAVRAHVLDVADAFANQFVIPALKAGALYADGRPMTTGLERALLAQKLVEIAAIEQTSTIAHGCPGGDRRVATAAQALDAKITVLALPPAVAGSAGCQMGLQAAQVGGLTSEAACVELTFVRGAPTAINGIPMPLGDLIGSINMLAGAHGIGRIQPLETPAAIVLHAAHQSLIDDAGMDEADWRSISRAYVDIIDSGEWFSTARRTLNDRIETLETPLSGTIRLKFVNGDCEIVEKKPLQSETLLKVIGTKG